MIAERLHRQLRANGVLVVSVSIGDEQDRATWTVQPDTLQAAAQSLIDAFVLPTETQLAAEEADRELNVKIIRALARELFDLVPNYAGKPTFVEFFQRVKARYQALAS